ncbi:hypothetical protein [Psychrobacillus vulpis]|uniref:Uncharacterized protein n=1 Tax=Psychrobacillus vulpis TaxID=2325572 RepID=A0A544TTI1_9BACI|nr:hypothetical protein [Psychrobacillus vulpis]TQR20710.1 hypothetical protein FG384_06355 [Psychrobacillus vulpis]
MKLLIPIRLNESVISLDFIKRLIFFCFEQSHSIQISYIFLVSSSSIGKQGIAFYSLRGVNNLAGMVFRYAKEVKLIKDNPTESAFIPKNKLELEDIDGSNVSKLYLEPDELEALLEYVNKYRTIIIPPLL